MTSRSCLIPPGTKLPSGQVVEASGVGWMVTRGGSGPEFQYVLSWWATRQRLYGEGNDQAPRTLMPGDRLRGYFHSPDDDGVWIVQAVGVDYFVACREADEYTGFWIVEDWFQFCMAVNLQRPVPQPFPGLRERQERSTS